MLDLCNLGRFGDMAATREAAIEKYRQVRRDSFARMNDLRERMDIWLVAHEDKEPTMADLATLEGLHGERIRIVAQLEAAEREMIDALLVSRPDAPRSTGVPQN